MHRDGWIWNPRAAQATTDVQGLAWRWSCAGAAFARLPCPPQLLLRVALRPLLSTKVQQLLLIWEERLAHVF